ncbi:class I SAM-dependent methyltransferase [Inquilinus sp. CAU 1745]|uniref:class I SAM-dependent methyltransferase n=1 Tax=Inquilinus sp. CAU 1745 TaxID=3140369 RepID=UPI00325B9C08
MTSPAMTESGLGSLYHRVYEAVCGKHPNVQPWHFQWLDARPLYARLHSLLPDIGSGKADRRVLDVGCGTKPYRKWFGPVAEYTGLDVSAGPAVDVVVTSYETWPLPSKHFDVVLCTQVLEHVEDLNHVCSEIRRVLRPGGSLIVSFPFLYNEHGKPWDFRRFTKYGARQLFPRMQVVSLECQGGIGSTLAIMLLNWWENTLNLNFPLRLAKAFLLPINIIFTAILNFIGVILDKLDRTEGFYNNVFMIAKKNADE